METATPEVTQESNDIEKQLLAKIALLETNAATATKAHNEQVEQLQLKIKVYSENLSPIIAGFNRAVYFLYPFVRMR